MERVERLITQVETACVKDNQVLSLSVNRHDVERCARVIREYGLLTPPVVGDFPDGTRMVLSGECEFLALREMGVRSVEAVAVSVLEEQDSSKLALLLASLRKSPNALSEGMLVAQLVKTGQYTQSQVAEMLGKSVSWVNKRISLITRLHPAVQELVTLRQLCPHSAQEIARLPEEIQHNFATKVVQEGLPKSAVEILVETYNKEGCPDSFKEQMLEHPRHALEKIADIRTVRTIRNRKEKDIPPSGQTLRNDLVLLLRCISDAQRQLGGLNHPSLLQQRSLLARSRDALIRFVSLLDFHLETMEVSPGKPGKEAASYGH
ncbi:ParB/RepB/Spo0J family partition protein [Desulfoscipio gibsoniae]|uniref:Putative transcriptional regulator n=1 Tax=Desulfoscipio gibsoniae DSM 7213 TaxID=767817 RepID=R4KNT1_9FIRM|nr:ParB/RepB/Spo0J family partition protein [Desulfoscipio gibsoniae]AGL03222.1 putative transcriptional regulator [Desulfoscipio gibsoniae DSM 7213]